MGRTHPLLPHWAHEDQKQNGYSVSVIPPATPCSPCRRHQAEERPCGLRSTLGATQLGLQSNNNSAFNKNPGVSCQQRALVVRWQWEGQAYGSGTEGSSTPQSRRSVLREALRVSKSSSPCPSSSPIRLLHFESPRQTPASRHQHSQRRVHRARLATEDGLHRVAQPCWCSRAMATQPADGALPPPRAPLCLRPLPGRRELREQRHCRKNGNRADTPNSTTPVQR